jgi:hypothetical protein
MFNQDELAALDSAPYYRVSASLPDRHDEVIDGAQAHIANIKLCVNILAGCFGDCDDPEFYYQAIADCLRGLDKELSRARKLVTAAVLGDEFAEMAYPQA